MEKKVAFRSFLQVYTKVRRMGQKSHTACSEWDSEPHQWDFRSQLHIKQWDLLQ